MHPQPTCAPGNKKFFPRQKIEHSCLTRILHGCARPLYFDSNPDQPHTADSGFYNGWTGRSNYWETQLFYDNATRGMIIANTVGWVVGLGARLWSASGREEDDERRGRGRSSRSAQAGSRRR